MVTNAIVYCFEETAVKRRFTGFQLELSDKDPPLRYNIIDRLFLEVIRNS